MDRLLVVLTKPNLRNNVVLATRVYREFYEETSAWHDEFTFSEYFAHWFVVAHELGHIALGHLDNSDTTVKAMIADRDLDLASATYQREQEFEADRWALEFMRVAFTPGDDLEGDYTLMNCARLFFEAMHFMRMFVDREPGLYGEVYGDTHPDPQSRVERIKRICPELAGEVPPGHEDICAICGAIPKIAEERRVQFSAKKIRELRKQTRSASRGAQGAE